MFTIDLATAKESKIISQQSKSFIMKKQVYLFAIIAVLISIAACSSSSNDPQPATAPISMPSRPTKPIYGTISDIGGNIYKTVTLGTQTWMAENLRVNKFNDGTPIKNIVKRLEWMSTKKIGSPSVPAYCWLNNDSATNAKPYGAYYNSFVVNVNTNGNRNIAPKGWHVANYYDWVLFEKFLTDNGYGFNGSKVIGKSLGTQSDSITDKYGWRPTIKDYALGTKPELNNKSGFNAYPNGARDASYGDTFYKQGVNVFWWLSSSEPCVIVGADAVISLSSRVGDLSEFGFGIRCVKD